MVVHTNTNAEYNLKHITQNIKINATLWLCEKNVKRVNTTRRDYGLITYNGIATAGGNETDGGQIGAYVHALINNQIVVESEY